MSKKFLIILLLLTAFLEINAQFNKDSLWGKDVPNSDNYLIGDYNGDGLPDKLRIDNNSGWLVALNSGIKFLGEETWAFNEDVAEAIIYVGDFNGDLMADVVTFRIASGEWKVSLTRQDSLTGKYSFCQPVVWADGIFQNVFNHFIGDFNGDGLDDIMAYSNGWQVITSNGKSFNRLKTWKNSETSEVNQEKIFIGDFNGDGFSDIAIYRDKDTCGIGKDVWLVSLANKNSSFSPFVCWASGQGEGSNGHFFGDLNGDRKSDKLNYYSGNGGALYASISSGNEFEDEKFWISGNIKDIKEVFAGDFNGDNLCDVATLNSEGEWYVNLNTTPHEKVVACWFTNWYFPGCGLWGNDKRDINKTPVVGWPETQPVQGELYNSNNRKTIEMQIDAMIKAGITLIIVDYTNGWKNYADTTKWEDDTAHAATNTLFSIMNERRLRNKPYINIAIGLGKEFWGPRSFKRLSWQWTGWSEQYKKQKSTLDGISQLYIKQYPVIYFNYLSKPLIIIWHWLGDDFPPREDGENIPLWHFNDFTIKESVNWSSTFTERAGPVSGVTDVFINGMDTKRYWGWGAEIPQPYNSECMSVMPGTYNWPGYYATRTRPAERLRGEPYSGSYYIESWERVIKMNPNIVLICDWNNWNEETAIEGCVGENSWEDLNGEKTFDWYMKITKYYSNIFLHNSLNVGTYIKQDGLSNVYKWSGSKLEILESDYKPIREPIIKLPMDWMLRHGYWRF
ncbi:MAG: FG-GAP-like repeat-containing protein [bacterium]